MATHGAVSDCAFFVQSLQYALRATASMLQSACRQRLPPPCSLQWLVSRKRRMRLIIS